MVTVKLLSAILYGGLGEYFLRENVHSTRDSGLVVPTWNEIDLISSSFTGLTIGLVLRLLRSVRKRRTNMEQPR